MIDRRAFIGGLLAASGGAIGARPVAAEVPPETTRLRVHHSQSLCLAPQYVAEDLLRGEGFTEVQYVRPYGSAGLYQALSSGEADIGNDFAPVATIRLDRGDPIVLQTMKDVVYTKWREYSPEDTVRFYALRLQEAGMVKSSPQKLVAQGTDWRFLNELKRELKT